MMDDALSKVSAQAFKDFHKKKYQEASDGFRTCVNILLNDGPEKDLAEMRNNLSVTLIELHEHQEAYDVVLGTEAVFERLGDKRSQAMAMANIGTALQALGRKEEALISFERSSDLFKETGEKLLRATILKKISDLQLTTGKPLQAIASMQASYDQKESKTFKEKLLGSALGKIFRIFIK
jgi:tetratricopeptide (TPR) repeat protein